METQEEGTNWSSPISWAAMWYTIVPICSQPTGVSLPELRLDQIRQILSQLLEVARPPAFLPTAFVTDDLQMFLGVSNGKAELLAFPKLTVSMHWLRVGSEQTSPATFLANSSRVAVETGSKYILQPYSSLTSVLHKGNFPQCRCYDIPPLLTSLLVLLQYYTTIVRYRNYDISSLLLQVYCRQIKSRSSSLLLIGNANICPDSNPGRRQQGPNNIGSCPRRTKSACLGCDITY